MKANNIIFKIRQKRSAPSEWSEEDAQPSKKCKANFWTDCSGVALNLNLRLRERKVTQKLEKLVTKSFGELAENAKL